jgi:predicted aspartyl protease
MHPLALMFAALLITLAWAPAAAASEPATVASIVAASGTALGTGALARAHGLDISGTIEVLGIKGTARTWQDLRDGNFATSTVAGPLSGDNGYDGSNVWNRDRYGVVFDDGSRAAAYGAVQAAYVGRYALWQPKYGGATVSLGAPQTLAGKSYDVLTITPKDGLPFDYWFDAATHLPFRTVVPISIITTTTTFADYRSFQGVQIATAQKQESVQGVSSFAVTDVRFDEPGFSKNLEHPHSTVSGFSIVGGAEATVPFELVDNHVYIDVSINGQGPYRFIFDTGGSLVIDTELAKKLGLNRAGSMQGIGVGENTDTFNFATIDSLSIGNATIGHLDGAIAPVRNGFSASGGEPVDGLIGSETLARFVTTFDYPNRRLTFRMPGAPPVAGGVTTPFVFSGTDPMLPCRIGSVDGHRQPERARSLFAVRESQLGRRHGSNRARDRRIRRRRTGSRPSRPDVATHRRLRRPERHCGFELLGKRRLRRSVHLGQRRRSRLAPFCRHVRLSEPDDDARPREGLRLRGGFRSLGAISDHAKRTRRRGGSPRGYARGGGRHRSGRRARFDRRDACGHAVAQSRSGSPDASARHDPSARGHLQG